MRNFFLIVIGSIILSISAYVHYKVFWSYFEQNLLAYDFNANQTSLPLEEVKNFIDDIPNITGATLPLKMLKARYYLKNSQFDEALRLLNEANKDNPFLGVNDIMIAQYHSNKKNLDSAFYYSKIAFESLPRNNVHSRVYFQTLSKLKKDSLLDSSFQKVKNYFILPQWRDYLFSKIEIGISPKKDLKILLNEAKGKIKDKKKLSTLETILNVGFENLDDHAKMILKAEQSFQQNEFIEAANLYQAAARIDNSNYTHYENAALSYYRANYYEEAENLFRYTLRTFDVSNGKSEFYLGLLMYEIEKKEEACKFWNISRNKGFSGSQRVIQNFCK